MTAFAAERLKLTTTRTALWLAAALAGIVTLAAVVHLVGFDAAMVDDASEQRSILTDIGVTMGLVFAAISGSLAITTEFRHGTIRPILLKHPDRTAVLGAKLATQAVIGAVLAAGATGHAVALAAIFLDARSLALALDPEDAVRLVLGAGLGGAAFAAGGLAIGTIVRNQVPVVVGLLIWTLFIENLLRAGVTSIGRFAPGSLARAIAANGTGALDSPAVATIALFLAVAIVVQIARTTFTHRDIA
jgi:ABC-2 type transport system permease protein